MELIPSLEEPYKKLQRAAWNELVFLTGAPSTGKTTLVKKLFEERQEDYLHAHIDCYSVKNQSQLLSKICQTFHGTMNVRRSRAGKTTSKLPEPGAPVSLNEFYEAILEYKKIAEEKGYRRIFIVLDQVEVLSQIGLVDTLAALGRYNLLDIRLIMISCEHPVDMFHSVAQKYPSLALSLQDRCQVVVCPSWKLDDMIDWILREPPKEGQELYKKFVRNVVSLVTTTQSKDPMIIRMYCQEHFGDFIRFYKIRRREQVNKKLGLDPNSSEITDEQLDDYEKDGGFSSSVIVSNFLESFKIVVRENKDVSKWTYQDTETHLTKNVALLIIAAYMASFTKLSDDKQNFVRYQRRKTSSRKKNDPEYDFHTKVFTLERLIQIYLELMKKSTGSQVLNFIENNDGVLADVENLKNLEIIHHQSGFQFCSESRYKLSDSVKHEFIARIAKNHELDLTSFQGLPYTFSCVK